MKRIGVDVGGTCTDAVLVENGAVRHAVKTATTADVTSGISTALALITQAMGNDVSGIELVAIGTTHFTNAVNALQNLVPVAAVRLGAPASIGLPPFTDWPEPLRHAIGGHQWVCAGGHEYDGSEITAVDRDELLGVATQIASLGINAVAISSVFSVVTPVAETAAAEILGMALPAARITLSHEVGRMGLLERENATILNAALRDLARDVVNAVRRSAADLDLDVPVYFTQNDGTLMSMDLVERYPVWTIASGPTNSMRGAALLSRQQDCVVIDVGGTTTDIGLIRDGFPREASGAVSLGGVRTNFHMPDMVSLAIGGGSIVADTGAGVRVGPESVGYELQQRARCYGGDVLTLTDLAVIAGRMQIGENLLSGDAEDTELAARGLADVDSRVADNIERVKTSVAPVPVVVVGGGSKLLADSFPGSSVVHRPQNYAVANAVGAAMAQVGGVSERVYSLPEWTRERALSTAKDDAIQRAVDGGAVPESVVIAEVDEVSLSYLPGSAIRIRVKAMGDADVHGARDGLSQKAV